MVAVALILQARDDTPFLEGGSMASEVPDGQDGFSVVFSPVQLAAVLLGATISTLETRFNRLWGVVTLIGSGIELIGSAALLLTPKPTMITKAGGIALGVHGSDTAATGIRQIWTGEREVTMTQAAVSAAARNLGADIETADKAGVAVDILGVQSRSVMVQPQSGPRPRSDYQGFPLARGSHKLPSEPYVH